VQQTVAEVAQTEAELRSNPGDTLLLEKLKYAWLSLDKLRDEKNKLRDEKNKLRDEKIKLIDKEIKLIDRLPLPVRTFPQAPFYSTYLAELGVETPFDQYGLYFSSVAGCTYAFRQMYRAHFLMKAAKETNAKDRLGLLALARAGEPELAHAVPMAWMFRLRGAVAVVGAPAMWLFWRLASRAKPASKQQ
jgi:hypothetical protein